VRVRVRVCPCACACACVNMYLCVCPAVCTVLEVQTQMCSQALSSMSFFGRLARRAVLNQWISLEG